MTIAEFCLKYTYGMDGQEPLSFDKFVEFLTDLAERNGGVEALTAATTNGDTVIGAGTGRVIATSAGSGKFLNLPAIADIQLGHKIVGYVGANGLKIRVAKAEDASTYINNDATTAHGVPIAASCKFEAEYVATGYWVVLQTTAAGVVSLPTAT
jgi:hypothetical protein